MGAAAASLAAAVWLLDLTHANLRVPFKYGGDALFFSMITKAVIDHGWFWTNPSLGAPGVLELHDFPAAAHDTFHVLLVKAMSIFSTDWALLFNLYFLLGFPLITLSAMAVFRHFRVTFAPAMVGAILYSFLPSRLIKGEGHIFMDSFYQVPLAVLVLLWVCGDDPPLACAGERGAWPRLEVARSRSWGALLICALNASTALYYAFFTTVLLVVGGLWASIERRSMRNFASGVILAAAMTAGLAANGLPTLVYHAEHGPNHAVGARGPWEAELYGMKIVQLLLPTDEHRLLPLRELKDYYNARAPLGGENGATSLGFVGAFGFFALLFAVLHRAPDTPGAAEREGPMRPLAVLNLMATLLGTLGGFGSLIALLVSPQIRTYCRISVLIAFFSLFAVVLLLDRLRRHRPAVVLCGLPVLLVVGLLDQATPAAFAPYGPTKARFASDADLVHRIEAAVPGGSAIFELPYVSFPEGLPIEGMATYDALRPYLHSHALRWSQPTMSGRAGDAWYREILALPPEKMLPRLAAAGFAGILVDRDGYRDHGCGVEAGFALSLRARPVASKDGRLSFLDLSECAGGGCDRCGGPTQSCCAGGGCGPGLVCAAGTCGCGSLGPDQHLAQGERLSSCDGRFSFGLPDDGDITVRGCGCTGPEQTCWRAGAGAHPDEQLLLQGDGNLVLFGGGCSGTKGSCWNSNTMGRPGARLVVQNDGNVCIMGGGCSGANGTCWCTGIPNDVFGRR